MANINTQVEYRFQGDAHYFFGRDRLSSGVMVANKDFPEALKQLKKQLKESVEMNDARGTPKCTLTDEDMEKHAKAMGHMMTLWNVDSFT